MSLEPRDPEVRRVLDGLAPYGRHLLGRAAEVALRVHADEVTPEHLLSALMDDELSAAHRIVLHGFADPETVSVEALATAPGILVVGSDRTIPFSVRGVAALHGARRLAAVARAARVRPAHVLRGAVEALDGELRERLLGAGYSDPSAAGDEERAGAADEAVVDEGPLFRLFADEARRLLALAARVAVRLGRRAIAPAHLVLAAVEERAELRERSGLSVAAARAAIGDRDEDATPVEERGLPPAEELGAFLATLPPGAGSPELLRHFLDQGAAELRTLLEHSRITHALLDRAARAFRDPEPPENPGAEGAEAAPPAGPERG